MRYLVGWSPYYSSPSCDVTCAMYCCTGILFLCFVAATVKSFHDQNLLTYYGGLRIVLNSSTVYNVFRNKAALYTRFYDASFVSSLLVNANFFKGFCEAQDLLTPYERSHVLLSTRKLLLDGKNQSRVVRAAPTRQNDPPPTSISFRISAWGAKHFMPCGVLLINFDTRKSYMNFLYNKSSFYEDLCHLKSKCFPVGTYLPITSSATFELGFGSYYQQAMIVNENLMVDGTVSQIIDAETLLETFKEVLGLNINPALVCKYAKRSLCNYGLAGQSAVFRYLPSPPSRIDNDNFFHLCSMMFNNTDLIDFKVALPRRNKIYVHPEIIVIKPLTHFEDHQVSISEVMRDLRVIHTIIVKYQFPIIISLIVFFITCCLKKYFFFLAYTVLTYSFNYCLFFLILLFVVLIVKIIRELELIKLVYECGCFLISIVIYHYLQLEVIPVLSLLLKVNKPLNADMMTTCIIFLSFQKCCCRRSQNVSNTPGITFCISCCYL